MVVKRHFIGPDGNGKYSKKRCCVQSDCRNFDPLNFVCINVNGTQFRFVDVPGDGNCFYHSILQSPHLHGKFSNVMYLRYFMQQKVMQTVISDSILQKIFNFYQTNYLSWSNYIVTMNEWAKPIDMIICSYLLRINIVSIGNYENGLLQNNVENSINMLLSHSNSRIHMNNTIYIYFHNFGYPLAKIRQGNHFGYLEPVVLETSIPENTVSEIEVTKELIGETFTSLYKTDLPSQQISEKCSIDDETPSLCDSISSTDKFESENALSVSTIENNTTSHFGQNSNSNNILNSVSLKCTKPKRKYWTKKDQMEVQNCYLIAKHSLENYELISTEKVYDLWKQKNRKRAMQFTVQDVGKKVRAIQVKEKSILEHNSTGSNIQDSTSSMGTVPEGIFWTNNDDIEVQNCYSTAKKTMCTDKPIQYEKIYDMWKEMNPTRALKFSVQDVRKRMRNINRRLNRRPASKSKSLQTGITKSVPISSQVTEPLCNTTVPNLCSSINRKDALNKCIETINRTKTNDSNHKSCVCVVCDCFIIGTESICWLTEEQLLARKNVLSVSFFESCTGRILNSNLRNQYKINNNHVLSDLLLSPRARAVDNTFMACDVCHRHIAYRDTDKPPKFAISNGWCIGEFPKTVLNKEVPDILSASLSKLRIFSNVFSYNAGAHKAIKGHHVFFLNDPEHVGASFKYIADSGSPSDIYVMICGRVTPSQRDIIKRRCTINTDDFKSCMNWLIENHPSYKNMKRPDDCPKPIIIGGFNETTNNTDEPEDGKVEIENSFDGDEMSFASRNEPTESTGPYQNQKEFVFSHMKGTKPTLLFRRGDTIGSHTIDLIELFPLIFPYGRGGPNERRATKVSKSAVLRHYCRIALPQMQQSQFLLVLCSMWQRMESFTRCTISCKSKFKSSTLAECLSTLSYQEVETAAKHTLSGEKTTNETLKKLFSSISGHTSSIGHSNEAASYARQKLFSLWHYYGAPAVFFTVTPCDECSFRVRLYATSEEHKLPDTNDIENQQFCILDLKTRKDLRSKYPGACAIEYQNIVQIVIELLIGWNNKTRIGSNGIFGKPLAYADCCEEQARYTLHSHISVWIENFNEVRNLLYHPDSNVQQQARSELELYFKTISQATFGDLFAFDNRSSSNVESVHNINSVLIPPRDQDLRHMRHHVHCQDLHGVVGYYPQDGAYCQHIQSGPPEVINSDEIVRRNTQVLLGGDSSINYFTKQQLDVLSYTYPYHMSDCEEMKPIDCQSSNNERIETNSLNDKIKQFNLRHPLLQLRFNIHDCYHRPSCFKKGPECRTELPQKHRQIATIQFEKNNTITWYFVDGTVKKVTPFKYYPKRNIGDQFMNINNDIATTVLGCNNNVTSGDKACFFYVTLYQTKHNQKEESYKYHSICLALSRRIKYQQELLNQQSDGIEQTEAVSPDFAEGLKHMMASLYAHTNSNVLSSTMAAKLLADGERFKFSHEFKSIPLKHLIDWAKGIEHLDFKLRTVKNADGDYEHVQDTFINNVIYRPAELENLCCYDIISQYEMKRMSSKKIESGNTIIESKTSFNLLQEHPGHKYMQLSVRKHFVIPCISSINLLPNIADLDMTSDTQDPIVQKSREDYAMIVLLLFCPYRTENDLLLDGSYWNKYKQAVSNGSISKRSLEICQNIQDVSYNCSKLKPVKDELELTTTYTPHDDDAKRQSKEDDNVTTIDEIATLFGQLDDCGISSPDPNNHRLSIIAQRHEIVNQEIECTTAPIPDITEIPEGIMSCISDPNEQSCNDQPDQDELQPCRNNQLEWPMVIDILNELVINQMSNHSFGTIPDNIVHNVSAQCLSFASVVSKFTLDFKQTVAFEIMASSFVLKSMAIQGISSESLIEYLQQYGFEHNTYSDRLKQLNDLMTQKGGKKDLVMFLSGMGGTGKSEVIKAFIHFAKGISLLLGWNYDNDVIKVTALTGAAACEIPNGKTLHSQACLSTNKVTQGNIESWKSTKMLIIDEISFLDEDNVIKLDKNMRKLKENNFLYGDVQVVFVGDFFQMLPVRGSPLFKNNTVQFNAINRAVFLNKSHRFASDPQYGEIMRRFRIGKITKEDIQKINSRYIMNPSVALPKITDIRCACYANDERNAYNNVIFLQHLAATHTSTNPPSHTCIIKADVSCGANQNQALSKSMYNRLIDECGDSDVTNGSRRFVDLALKFFHNIPLMMNSNDRIEEELANGTPCRGLYVQLKKNQSFTQERWEGYMVNTVLASKVKYIVCMQEGKYNKYFTVRPKSSQCKVRLRMFDNMVLDKIKITYLPINSNISTTGHKLQGKTLQNLVVNSWAYGCTHWVYVVLSRVRELKSLILNQKLDIQREYKAKEELVKWERKMKDTIEKQSFFCRGMTDLEKYIQEEKKYQDEF